MQSISEEAHSLHRRALVFDAHCDILIPVADGLCSLSRRVQLPSPSEWTAPPGFGATKRPTPYELSDYAAWFSCAGQYDVPAFQSGGVTAQTVAVYISEDYLSRPVERAMSLIAALHRELRANSQTLMLARAPDDIDRARQEGKTALLLAFEGAEALGHDLDLLDAYHALGLRMLSLTHSRRNAWAEGTQMNTVTGGLTVRGRQLVHRLNELGIILDLAHLNDTGFWEVLSQTQTPPVISHTSLLKEYEGYRAPLMKVDGAHQKSKLQALADLGGVVGILFWDRPTLEAVVDDIMLALEHAGERHVGLGSDLFSRDRAPADLQDMSALPRLTEALMRRGLSEETILNVLGRNWLRVFEAVTGYRSKAE
ncbi:MAG: dipeptidase [Chloroflexota bacterium]